MDKRVEILGDFESRLEEKVAFKYLKINHGFWDRLAFIIDNNLWPKNQEDNLKLDKQLNLPYFFSTNYFNELMYLLDFHKNGELDNSLCASVSAEPRKAGMKEKNANRWVIETYLNKSSNPELATIMKYACETGEIVKLLESIKKRRVVIVAPYIISLNSLLCNFENIAYVDISFSAAYLHRWRVLRDIENEISGYENPVILIQAGTLSVFWGTILALRFPDLTILDLGIALGVIAPQALICDPGVWQVKSGAQIFETAQKIKELFGPQKSAESVSFAKLAEISFQARQLSLPRSRNENLMELIIDLKKELDEIETQFDFGESNISAARYWLSRALASAGQLDNGFPELIKSLAKPIKGFHRPQQAQIEIYIKEKNHNAAVDLLLRNKVLYPGEISFLLIGERISKHLADVSFSDSMISWRQFETEVATVHPLEKLPLWKEDHGTSLEELKREIANP